MRAMARWLMAVVGLLAVLCAARIASAAEGKQAAPATPGIADEVQAIQDAVQGRDRGEAVSEVARGQHADDSSDDGGGKDPVDPPTDDGGTK